MTKQQIIEGVIQFMEKNLGKPYSQAKRMESGYFDCSSLVYRAYESVGITLTDKDSGKPVSTSCYEVYAKGFHLIYPNNYDIIGNKALNVKDIVFERGDILFYCCDAATKRPNRITHVATCYNPTQLIQTYSPKSGGVRLDKITWNDKKIMAVIRRQDETQELPVPPKSRVLKLTVPNMTGSDVLELQQGLARLGFSLGKADGVFGKNTQKAVINFQKKKRLIPDGLVGQSTAMALGIPWI